MADGNSTGGATSPPVAPPHPPPQPTIYEAITLRAAAGAVQRGAAITQAQAEARRRTGLDVVVCGPVEADNYRVARQIEQTANGPPIHDPPHSVSAGPQALPHFHPVSRRPRGHAFYETIALKAI